MDANGLSDSYCRVSIIPSNGGHVSIITNFDLCNNPMFTEFCQSVTYLESLFFSRKKKYKKYVPILIQRSLFLYPTTHQTLIHSHAFSLHTALFSLIPKPLRSNSICAQFSEK